MALGSLRAAAQDDTAWKGHMEKFGAAKEAGHLAEAAHHLEAALGEAEKLGPKDPRTAVTLLNLGAVYGEQGQFAKAEPVLRRAASAFEAAFGPDHAYVSVGLGALAFDLAHLGKHAEAEGLYRRVLAILDKTGEPEGPDKVSALVGLADTCEAQGKLAEAEALQGQVLGMAEKHAGANNPALAPILEKRASLLRKLGRGAEAEQAEARASAIAAATAEQEMRDAAGPRYKGKSARQWVEALGQGNMEAFHDLSAPDKEAVPMLAEMLGSDVSRARSVAASGLAHIGSDAQAVVGPLGKALKDRDLNVRYFAAQALSKIGPAAAPAVPALIGALDTHPGREPDLEGPPRYYKDARAVAAEALGAIGPAAKAAVPRLREVAAKDEEPEVRAAAAEALKKIEPK
jgi:tetratricopeptide (TPR) repeat protein